MTCGAPEMELLGAGDRFGWVARPGHQAGAKDTSSVWWLRINRQPHGRLGQPDGANWEQVSNSPWNAVSPDEIKYDFDVLVSQGGKGGLDRLSLLLEAIARPLTSQTPQISLEWTMMSGVFLHQTRADRNGFA